MKEDHKRLADDEVICPACAHNFPAIPQSAQSELSRLRAENARMRETLDDLATGDDCEGNCNVFARKALTSIGEAKPEPVQRISDRV